MKPCTDCKKDIKENAITYYGLYFHEDCFIRRIKAHCTKETQDAIFTAHGIRADKVIPTGTQPRHEHR